MDEPKEQPALDTRRRRILFRATHRGMQETDRLVGGFVAARVAGFSDDELAAVERILELVDADLADWLLGRAPIPPAHDTPMLRAMLADVARSRPIPEARRP